MQATYSKQILTALLRAGRKKRLLALSMLIAVFVWGSAFWVLPASSEARSTADGNAPVVVKVGAYENYPKVFKDDSGNYAGIFPDIVSAIAAKEGWEIQYVPCTWSECLERLESREIDVMVDVAYSQQRARRFAFSDESTFINWGVVYTRGGLNVEGLTDLQGLRVAVMQGSIHTSGEQGIKNILDRFSVKPKEYIEVAGYKEVFGLLDTEQADAGVVNRIFGAVFAMDYNVEKTPIIFNPRQLHFAFPLDSPRTPVLKAAIDNGLRELKKDNNSIYYQSLDRYLSIGSVPHAPNRADRGGKKVALTDEERAWVKDHPVIRYAIDPEFVPYEFLGADGSYNGIVSDYVKLLSERLGVEFQRVPDLQWVDVAKKIKQGELDVLPCVGKTEERQDYLLFSRPYSQFHRVIITRSNAPFITGLEDIAGLRVAVQKNSSNALMRKSYEDALERYTSELQQANDSLQDLDRLKSMFIASMSHELRTPLNSIIGFTGVMLQGLAGDLNPTQKDQLTRVQQASRHLLELITDVIDISKIESGRIDVYVQEFSLGEVIEEAVTTVESQIRKKSLDLHLNMDGDVALRTDRKRVLQCLINLLSNAVKYTEQGEITLDVVKKQEFVEIRVTDTGIGIDAKDLPRLFHAFERFDSHLKVKAGGTGLGLYLTSKLVTDLLRGDVLVESELGRGSTFGLCIPVDLEKARKNEDVRPEEKA